MAPLSKDLTGVILPHEPYGTYLDNNGKTIDEKKEKDNFANVGKTLAEILSNNVIDGHDVVSEYVSPENATFSRYWRIVFYLHRAGFLKVKLDLKYQKKIPNSCCYRTIQKYHVEKKIPTI